ncbi:N-acyl homoserine lactonase family protein [Ottowia thiooxydans]|uniref:Glyoxylase-like metal-dependent hydrolase (Beta-lactamase superfamily II) n=1 Tax=Ottowia thiooxydans TaxID=219182 RepID=A0ABV2Q778_9BURK
MLTIKVERVNDFHSWRVDVIELARRTAHRSWFFYLSEEQGVQEIAYRAWLLRNGTDCVLVDTGPPLDEAHRRGLRDVVRLDVALSRLGVGLGQIRDVVLTHLHWDHAASADLFPHARFYIQRKEIEFFRGPAHDHPVTARFFSHRKMLSELLESGRVEPVDGKHVLRDGLNLVQVGGHTPGSQIVAVRTSEGLAVITGDAIPLNRNYTDLIPNGILVSVPEAVAALRTVRALQPTEIYTGHDVEPNLRLPR